MRMRGPASFELESPKMVSATDRMPVTIVVRAGLVFGRRPMDRKINMRKLLSFCTSRLFFLAIDVRFEVSLYPSIVALYSSFSKKRH